MNNPSTTTTTSSSSSTSNKKGYSTIPSIDNDDDDGDDNGSDDYDYGGGGAHQKKKRRRIIRAGVGVVASSLLAALLFGILGGRGVGKDDSTTTATSASSSSSSSDSDNPLPMPAGVNLASWLSLEDYFFVGRHGALEVATTEGTVAAHCLPPLLTGQQQKPQQQSNTSGPMWNSETDLFANLTQEFCIQHAVQVFHAFRTSYVDFDEDLAQIAALGIRRVRVSLSWCLTDSDPSSDELLLQQQQQPLTPEEEQTLLDRYACVDPYFLARDNTTVVWPAVPRKLVADFFRACGRHGLEAVLDVHTYPGGTSVGTFSGVWPRKPLFWDYDDPQQEQNHGGADLGRTLFRDLLAWLESLDDAALKGLGGITPMNEPAHLAGVYNNLPSLTDALARDYLDELERNERADGYSLSSNRKLVSMPDGPHLRVLKWQSDALAAFRATSLPHRGIELVVNLHESVFGWGLAPDDAGAKGGRDPEACGLVAAWWRGTTTRDERRTWAVIDMHHYHAWTAECQGTVNRRYHGSSYVCGDVRGTDKVLRECVTWASVYRTAFQEQLEDPTGTAAKLMSGEFSPSTHHSVLYSCTDPTTLRKSYLGQVEAASQAGVDLFFWSWKMPYGGAFRSAWSFRHFLYLVGGVPGFSEPDEPPFQCGAD